MAMTSVKLGESVFGNKRVTWGSWSGTGTTVEIKTGLAHTEFIGLQMKDSSAVADEPAVNETLPKAGDITVVMTSGKSGYWWAFGDA